MDVEYNRDLSEYARTPEESASCPENSLPPPEHDAPEWQTSEEFPRGRPRKKKKRGRALPPAVGVVAVAAVLVMAAAGGLLPPRAQASILSADGTDTAITVDVDVAESVDDLACVVYNDFTRRSFPLAKGENTFTAADLTPGMRYTVAVVMPSALGDITLDERTVSTSLLPPVTRFLGIEHECTCNVDGYFHYTMSFRDENGWWSHFRATLTDENGNVSECVFTGDLQGDQRIDVALHAGLLGRSATFTVTCETSDPSAPQRELVLYTAEVKI